MSAISLSLLRAIMLSIRSLERRDRGAGHIAERRPLVAEDPRVAVLVGADRVPDPEVVDHAGEDGHGVLEARVLRIGLDPCEVGFGARALDLELRHEHRGLATDALRVDHRPLVREEPEAREVLDVVRSEEDVAGQAVAPDVLEQPLAPVAQVRGGDSENRFGAWLCHRVVRIAQLYAGADAIGTRHPPRTVSLAPPPGDAG